MSYHCLLLIGLLLPGANTDPSGPKCNTDTGGTCKWFGCGASRGPAFCTNYPDYKCKCNDGFCATAAGYCQKEMEIDSCQKDTGGRCSITSCYTWRGPTECKNGECLCKEGFCAATDKSGQCHPASLSCNRDTGCSCALIDCLTFQGSVCMDRKCMCPLGSCSYRVAGSLSVCFSAAKMELLHDVGLPVGAVIGGFAFFFWCICVPWTGAFLHGVSLHQSRAATWFQNRCWAREEI